MVDNYRERRWMGFLRHDSRMAEVVRIESPTPEGRPPNLAGLTTHQLRKDHTNHPLTPQTRVPPLHGWAYKRPYGTNRQGRQALSPGFSTHTIINDPTAHYKANHPSSNL